MPRTEKIYTKSLHLKITPEQFERWKDFSKQNDFDSISMLIRHATDLLVEGRLYEISLKEERSSLKESIEKLQEDNKELLSTQNKILKLIAFKSKNEEQYQGNTPLKEFKKSVIINLLRKEPKDEKEILEILDDTSEIEVLVILNDLIKASIITQDKDKYKVI